MTAPDYLLAAARYRLGLLDTGGMVEWADELLSRGIYTYSLGELATGAPFRQPYEWFLAALGELSVAVPSVQEAADLFMLRWVEDIAEWRREASAAVFQLVELAAPWKSSYWEPNPLSSHPVYQEVLGFYYGYEASYDWAASPHAFGQADAESTDPALTELAKQIMTFAREWVEGRYRDAFGHVGSGDQDSTAVRIARTIRAEGRYDELPVLADALEEEGWMNPEVLQHCRIAPTHPDSCWVIELLLGAAGHPG